MSEVFNKTKNSYFSEIETAVKEVFPKIFSFKTNSLHYEIHLEDRLDNGQEPDFTKKDDLLNKLRSNFEKEGFSVSVSHPSNLPKEKTDIVMLNKKGGHYTLSVYARVTDQGMKYELAFS